ncbi:MAG: FHA domain-containing protein [Candidatus Eremiobacteraeota bacterium]|nr:FHA domain-containing protein [Candidatus Eremiobacteraeota bacterium]
MIIKRLGIFFAVLIIGIGVGIFAIDYFGKIFHLSTEYSNLVMLAYIIAFILIALKVGKNIPKEGEIEEDIVIPSEMTKSKGRSYAWLNPYGTEAKAGYPITKKMMIIGRDVNADILINDLSMSRKHAHILSLAGGFILRDLESNNGTFINNQRIEESYLTDGDVITFGEVKFVFTCSSVRPVLEPASDGGEITLDIDIDMDHSGTYVSGTKTGSRITGTRTGTRSGTRFKDFNKEKHTPPDKRMDNNKKDTGTNPIND